MYSNDHPNIEALFDSMNLMELASRLDKLYTIKTQEELLDTTHKLLQEIALRRIDLEYYEDYNQLNEDGEFLYYHILDEEDSIALYLYLNLHALMELPEQIRNAAVPLADPYGRFEYLIDKIMDMLDEQYNFSLLFLDKSPLLFGILDQIPIVRSPQYQANIHSKQISLDGIVLTHCPQDLSREHAILREIGNALQTRICKRPRRCLDSFVELAHGLDSTYAKDINNYEIAFPDCFAYAAMLEEKPQIAQAMPIHSTLSLADTKKLAWYFNSLFKCMEDRSIELDKISLSFMERHKR